IRMNAMNTAMAGGYRATLFEMVSVSEDMDNNLSKLRVASGNNEQRKLITDLLVDSALMESAIERIPVDNATSTDISAFVNKTGSYCRKLLARLASGESLTETERNTLTYLYNVNSKLYGELNHLATHMTEDEFRAFLNGKEGEVSQKFGEMGQGTTARPEETVDAPFTGEGNVGENKLEKLEEVSSSKAEELVKEYFTDYHVREVKLCGETVSKSAECYNFILTDENDAEIYAQITKRGGKLAFFDTYEICNQKNFDLEACDALARKFLSSLGIENVEAVWVSDAGMVADLTYVSVQDGVRAYPDMVRVRVCEQKGRVVGMDAIGYLINHSDREYSATLARGEAQERLSSSLNVKDANLAFVPVDGKETLAYEFYCSLGEDEYIVYLDANDGEEIQVYRVRESARGSYLR
ncbi:MAG: PepSY1/2 domain-containing protein, partial [Candidatus Gallimonas sp.]